MQAPSKSGGPEDPLIDKGDNCCEKTKVFFDLLLSETSQGPTISTISIIGMGGIGKTTLARLVFNDVKVNTHFDKKIWVCVSDLFDEIRVAKAILESLGGDASNIETVLEKIHRLIEGKKFLLVLDDVWTEQFNKWEQLMSSFTCGSQGSRILVTTRKVSVADAMRTTNKILLETLSEDECWSLFRKIAFFGKTPKQCESLSEIGRKVVGKCKGLPLAVKSLGSLLCSKRNIQEWQSVLDSDIWKLEEVEDELFRPLLLSYMDLSSTLKKCFSYCSIFPKGYKIEKDRLIKLWMAQSYIRAERIEDMESVGEKYFENLAMRSFFQDFEKDERDGSIKRCKMHDIVHDFARFLTRDECLTLEESQGNYACTKARHTRITLESGGSLPVFVYKQKKLRSLIVECRGGGGGSLIDIVTLSEFFRHLTCLKTLDLTRTIDKGISRIPRGIEKLIHLRDLNLSYTQIIEFPEMLCELYNLQTLDLSYCSRLKKLPKGIGKLINLGYLINVETNELSFMPNGIERLTRLRTLSQVVVNGGRHGSLQCLRNLNHLRGSLIVKNLGEFTCIDEAKRVQLQNKKGILSLHLIFIEPSLRKGAEGDKEILEALQPPQNLNQLEISYYRGKTMFSNWLMSFTKLSKLKLNSCVSCECLPPLGKLPSLESLIIWDMWSLKGVGTEFLGIESDGTSSSSSIIAFPKLKSLYFRDMKNWEEWDYSFPKWAEEIEITIMPCLLSVSLVCCLKLKVYPDHILHMVQRRKLVNFDIRYCPNLVPDEGYFPDFYT